MKNLNVKFRDNYYTIACNDEARVSKLAEKFNSRAENLALNLSSITDSKLAIITGLMLEDEIERANEEKASIPRSITEAQAASNMSKTLNQISDYIEELASRLEKS